MSYVRERMEHMFALHKVTWDIFSSVHRFQLLLGGVVGLRSIVNSFFILNCYTYMNESPNNFAIQPPVLEEYTPLEKFLYVHWSCQIKHTMTFIIIQFNLNLKMLLRKSREVM